jgi:hypothetical protein
MRADHRVPLDGGERCHIQGIADSDPTAGDGSFAAQLAGVAIDRCDTDEGSDTTAIELAEFG